MGARRFLALMLAVAAAGCAPVFSDLQSAKLVGKGRVEFTPGFSSVYSSENGGSDHVQNHAGIQVAAGVHDAVDVRVRYERVTVEGESGVNVLAFGPKVRLFKGWASAYVPIGFAFGGGIDAGKSWAVHPTLLLTGQLHPTVEVNWSAKYLVPLHEEGGDNLVAFNVGLGLGPPDGRWAIRPELGMLFDPGEQGHFNQWSIGFSVRPR
jgi:hypothetical protein